MGAAAGIGTPRSAARDHCNSPTKKWSPPSSTAPWWVLTTVEPVQSPSSPFHGATNPGHEGRGTIEEKSAP